jgi:hypothetical protein
MAETLGILAQSAPSATTESILYTVPSSTTATISSLVICNRSSTSTTFRVAVCPDGGATSNEDYIYYDCGIGGNDTFIATIGITLGDTDVIRVYAGTANLSFNLFGVEVTP